MRKAAFVISVGLLLTLTVCASDKTDYKKINKQAAREYCTPIRPGYEGKNPYWNPYSVKFIYAPAFDFPECRNASSYLFTIYLENQDWQYQPGQKVYKDFFNVRPSVIPDDHISWSFKADSPKASLAKIWNEIPQGNMVLKVEALDRKGEVIKIVGTRKFLKDFPFVAPAEPAARTYREAAMMALLYCHNHPAVKYWQDHDTPMLDFSNNSYAAKNVGSTVLLEALVMKMLPRFRGDAEKAARNAAKYLMGISFSEDNFLAHFPPTYRGPYGAASEEENQNTTMVMEALYAATGYLEFFDATGDSLYFNAAIKIADGYKRIQQADGSIPVKVYIDSGKPVRECGAMLSKLLLFYKMLHDKYGINDYEEARIKSEKWMRENPGRTLDFIGQFEDVSVAGWRPYESFTNCTAAPYASYLLKADNVSGEDAGLARDIIAICEDQLVSWDCFKDKDGQKVIHTPCVCEQFPYRRPIDDSACNMANAWLDYYEATGDRLAYEKGLAMVNSITNVQDADSGKIPTGWYDFHVNYDLWFNCIAESIMVLLRASDLIGEAATVEEPECEHRIFLAGDSTCCDYSDYKQSARPRCGWGEMFQDFFKDNIRVVNYAKSGRSSKSFISEGHWQKLIDEVKPEDYVFLQFGHNDGKVKDTSRYADPSVAFKDYQRRFINEVRAKGGIPVLVTNTTKINYDGDEYKGGNLSYAQSMRELAVEMNVPLLELEKRMASWMSGLTQEEARDYFCSWKKFWVNSFEDREDGVHLNYAGAAKVAGMVVDAVKESGVEPLRSWIRDDDSEEFKDYDIYLAIGQSNMAGRGYMISRDTHPVEGVWLLDDEGKPVRARNPFNQYSSIRKSLLMQQISPAYSFSTEMNRLTGRRILMVVNAKGGTGIDEWKKGTHNYDEAVRRAREAMEYGHLKGIIWHQGCTDAMSGKSEYVYGNELKQLIADLRAEFGDETLPFVAGGLPIWNAPDMDAFNEHIKMSTECDVNSGYVSSHGLAPRANGDGHFSRQSQIEFGKRYAERMNTIFNSR